MISWCKMPQAIILTTEDFVRWGDLFIYMMTKQSGFSINMNDLINTLSGYYQQNSLRIWSRNMFFTFVASDKGHKSKNMQIGLYQTKAFYSGEYYW